MRPFWLAVDCMLDMVQGGWCTEKEKGDAKKDVAREEWARDFVCFTLEGLAGERDFVNVVDLGERFNLLTNNVYAGIR